MRTGHSTSKRGRIPHRPGRSKAALLFILVGTLWACGSPSNDPAPRDDLTDSALDDGLDSMLDSGATDAGARNDAGASEEVLGTLESGALRLTLTTVQMTLSRGDAHLLRFPLDAFQLGLVTEVSDAVNYDPY